MTDLINEFSLIYFNGSKPTQMNVLTIVIMFINTLKQGISVEPDVKPAAVMNHMKVVHF